jgi:acetyltransferase-like isoleucine patch superfamily enzyme
MVEAHVDPTARLNVPLRMLQGAVWSKVAVADPPPLQLPERIFIGPYATVGCGVRLGNAVVIDAYCSIDPDAVIGERTILIYRANVGGGSTIGDDCVIGGFIPERTKVGNRCRILGHLIHTHDDPTMSWDHHDVPEKSPTVEDDVFVGFGAKIIGGLTLHERSYVAAGTILTRDVPSGYVAYGVNQIVPRKEWPGRLRDSPFFDRA